VPSGSGVEALRQLGTLVRRYRAERQMSCRDLARRAGVALGTISHLENGTHRPTVGTFTRILEALELDPATAHALWTLYGQEQPDPGSPVSREALLREIQSLAGARQRAWLRGDSATARALTDELERLWEAYRVTRASDAGNSA
jgi:transcriptional regulator with XRE-family HTH domain